MPELARELVRTSPDAIIAISSTALRAVRQATNSVPIIAFGPDLVAMGLAASLAKPAGNVTGVSIFAPELDGKRLDLLHAAIPARRVAAPLLRNFERRRSSEEEMRAVAASDGIELLLFDAAGPEDYPAAFAAMARAGVQALVLTANPIFARDAGPLAELALKASLPTACEWAEMAQAGCMLGYGPSRSELRRRMAHYIARILQGAAPADLPIEQPTRYEFTVNLTTARALGVTIPLSILARADEVIE